MSRSCTRIVIYAIGHAGTPSTRFRILPFLNPLKNAGFSVKFLTLPLFSGNRLQKFLGMFFQALLRFFQLIYVFQADIVVVQKGLTPWRCRGLHYCLSLFKKPIIYDIDDAIYLVSPVTLPKYFRWLQDEEEPQKFIKYSNTVIVGNEYLRNHVSQFNKNVFLIPTTIDTQEYIPATRVRGEKITIGWSGSASTNLYVNRILPVLNELAKEHAFTFLIISTNLSGINTDLVDGFDIQFLPWQPETEVEYLNKIHVGLMPLADDEYSKGKCGLKALQYMSLKIPAVCSPVGVNSEIIENGENGYLATSDEEWLGALKKIMQGDACMEQMGQNARSTVLNKYSVEGHISLLVDIIKQTSDL